jgi:hypothetical protein
VPQPVTLQLRLGWVAYHLSTCLTGCIYVSAPCKQTPMLCILQSWGLKSAAVCHETQLQSCSYTKQFPEPLVHGRQGPSCLTAF